MLFSRVKEKIGREDQGHQESNLRVVLLVQDRSQKAVAEAQDRNQRAEQARGLSLKVEVEVQDHNLREDHNLKDEEEHNLKDEEEAKGRNQKVE